MDFGIFLFQASLCFKIKWKFPEDNLSLWLLFLKIKKNELRDFESEKTGIQFGSKGVEKDKGQEKIIQPRRDQQLDSNLVTKGGYRTSEEHE